jgi:hypothetical protein
LIFALLACFALGVIQLRKLHAALLVRPRQTIPRAITYGVFGVVLCALPLADTILFAAGRPSAIVSLASARAGWCDLTKLNAEKSQQIGVLTQRVAELEQRLAAAEPAAMPFAAPEPAPAPMPLPASVPEAQAADPAPAPTPVVEPEEAPPALQPAIITPPQPRPKPVSTASIDGVDAEVVAEEPAVRREDFRIVVYYRKSHGSLAGTLSSRMGERFETVAEPSDLMVRTIKPPGTIRIVYTDSSAFALPDVRKALSDALRDDPERVIVADKVSELRNGDLQIQLF